MAGHSKWAQIKRKKASTDVVRSFEPTLYQAYGPGGVALLISALTDNTNRTGQEIRFLETIDAHDDVQDVYTNAG